MDLSALKEAIINGDLKGCTVLTDVAIQADTRREDPQRGPDPRHAGSREKFRCNEVYVPEVLVPRAP